MASVFVDGVEYYPKPPSPTVDCDFGDYLKQVRDSFAIPIEYLSKASGIDVGRLMQLERNEGVPLFAEAARIAWALNLDLNLLGVALGNNREAIEAEPFDAPDDTDVDIEPNEMPMDLLFVDIDKEDGDDGQK